ncbi:methyl-accepting chemotaxis protein [Methanomicrobium sp. W14]|uniref:methyl-accepting chemotaxis protein n=1 Tax=Methanomicrobium sp. W14 TaxID=2817839 RepID=UPI001AE1FC35|nr:methyl-accepting chemotaxis protein [Methanomicrobium sp. W14]MBP2133715.1 methyl-accepting chemotaxis protein [Methanomicrobium sp. W14]
MLPENIENSLKNFLDGNTNSMIDLNNIDKEYYETGSLLNRIMAQKKESDTKASYYNDAINYAPVPIAVLNSDLKFTAINEDFISLTGYKREKLLSMTLDDFHFEFRLEKTEGETAKEAIKFRKRAECRYIMNSGGTERIISASSVPAFNKNNELTGVYISLKDVTRIEEQKAFYESVLSAIPFPISVTDLDMKWTYINPATAKMANIDIKEAIGLPCSRWNTKICNNGKCAIERLKKGEKTTYFDQNNSHYLANMEWIRDAEGKNTGHVEVVLDITESVSIEEYLKKEVKKVADDLKCIAEGRLQDINFEVGEADQYTEDIRKQFLGVTGSVKSVYSTLDRLVSDINSFINAGKDGNLDFKADGSLYKGSYIDIIEGINALMHTFSEPVYAVMNVCRRYADADFKARFDENINVKGSFLELKNAVDNIGVSVSEMLSQTSNMIEMVSLSSNDVNKGTSDVAKVAEGVANASQKTADLTKDLLEDIEEVNRQIADLSASNEEIAGTSQEVYNATNHVVEIGKEAQGLGNDANTKMINVENIAKASVEEIQNLTESIKEVGKVVKLINDITGQINLLALNAAIEAARAGEHGRGFAVVAGEVKNLAGEARDATNSIETVVSKVQSGSEKTAQSITTANAEIMEGVESVTKTIEALNTIIKNAGQVSNDVGEITKAIGDQANISNNIVKSMEAGTEQTKNVQKETEELAELAEEASASIEEIGSAMHEVNSFVKELGETNSRFKY